MKGRKVYEFALSNVPVAMKPVLMLQEDISNLKKIFIHQANMKMDEAIIKRFYRLYRTAAPSDILPMNIQKHGNSSVATIPTLYDQVLKNELDNHQLQKETLFCLPVWCWNAYQCYYLQGIIYFFFAFYFLFQRLNPLKCVFLNHDKIA